MTLLVCLIKKGKNYMKLMDKYADELFPYVGRKGAIICRNKN
jgi:hypothetical protein